MTVSPKNASKGDTVTVTVKPDSGYVLETLTVTDKNGNELTLKDKGNGKYTLSLIHISHDPQNIQHYSQTVCGEYFSLASLLA